MIKRRRVSQITSKEKADLFLVQEDKLSYITKSVARSFWENSNVG